MRGAVRFRTRLPHSGVSTFRGIGPHRNGPQTERASGWPLETIEIDASLPKLKKAGWLRAIRRTFPAEKPHYDVLEIAGDRTVKNQVIARYLSATEKATTIPVSSVAITPANYEI